MHVASQNLLSDQGSDWIRSQVFARRSASATATSASAASSVSVAEVQSLLPHQQFQQQVQAGANITITQNALGPVIAAAAGQASIQFEYEGANLGTSGTATEVNFTGAALVASRAADKVTVNVAVTGGGGGTSDIGLVLQLPFLPTFL